MSFDTLGLSAERLRAVRDAGFDAPTPIQAKAIPPVLEGRDVLAAAQTGTGKTAAFALPMLDRLAGGRAGKRQARALILTPTRELAAQVHENFTTLRGETRLSTTLIFGGVGQNPQVKRMAEGRDILVATPGRLLDLHGQGHIDLSAVETLVLDEADRMLDMGFIHDMKKVMKLLPERRQTLLFSATFSKDIRKLAGQFLSNPVEVDVAPRNSTAERVEHAVLHVGDPAKANKAALLIHLLQEQGWHQVLVFHRTKHGANKLTRQLEQAGNKAAAIHGNKSQTARTKALEGFKTGKITVLVATDIAARGLDIEQLPVVINHDLPNVPEDYVHRIGRTARAGAEGLALSLVGPDDRPLLRDIEKLLGHRVDVRDVEGHTIKNPPTIKGGGRPSKSNTRPGSARARPQNNRSGKPNGNRRRRRRGGGSGGQGAQR